MQSLMKKVSPRRPKFTLSLSIYIDFCQKKHTTMPLQELHCAATKCSLSQSLNEMEDELKNNPITDSQNGVVVDDEDDDTPTLSSETLAEQTGLRSMLSRRRRRCFCFCESGLSLCRYCPLRIVIMCFKLFWLIAWIPSGQFVGNQFFFLVL